MKKPTRWVLALLAGGAWPTAALAEHAAPLHIRNLNPLVAVFGLPSWDTFVAGQELRATVEVANHYRLSLRGEDLLILDGETVRTTVGFSHGFDSGWSVGAELPYYRLGGGVLDDVIDGWHSAFAMPDGGRNNRPEGQLLFRLADADGEFLAIDRAQSGSGDLQLKVARALGPARQFVVQASVKVPTGDPDSLAGSGSADWALTLLRARPLLERRRPASYFWGVGVIRAGEPESIRFVAEEWAYTAVLGGSWQPWPKFGLKAQLDWHSPFFDTPLEELGEGAIQASFGAWREVGRRGLVEIAVVEDLEVSTAPDVVLQVAARWRW